MISGNFGGSSGIDLASGVNLGDVVGRLEPAEADASSLCDLLQRTKRLEELAPNPSQP